MIKKIGIIALLLIILTGCQKPFDKTKVDKVDFNNYEIAHKGGE